MITIEAIYKKAKYLDTFRLQELNDFLDFLLQKKKMKKATNQLFPRTELEVFDSTSPYSGELLSLDQQCIIAPRLVKPFKPLSQKERYENC